MKAIKGFRPDMTCDPTGNSPFQFAEGETYELDAPAIVCKRGFHAVTMPLDVLAYYPPSSSVYHEVEVDDDAQTHYQDSKVASRRIKIGARLDIAGLVKAQVAMIFERSTVEPGGSASGNQGAAQASGDQGAAQASGDRGAAQASGDRGAAQASGNQGAAQASGNRGAAQASGYQGAAQASGDRGAAIIEGAHGTALAAGWKCRAKGVEGAWLGLVERSYDPITGKTPIVGKPVWVQVGSKRKGKTIKAGVFYGLVGGCVVEVDEYGEAVK